MQIFYGGYLWDYLKKLFSRFSLFSINYATPSRLPLSMRTFRLTENPFGVIFDCFSQRGFTPVFWEQETLFLHYAQIVNPHRQRYGY